MLNVSASLLLGTCSRDRSAENSLPAKLSESETTSRLFAGCTPIENTLMNGSVLRNDTEEGRVIYRFRCDPGFRLNGSTVISCFQGQWNGSMPNCNKKCKYSCCIFTLSFTLLIQKFCLSPQNGAVLVSKIQRHFTLATFCLSYSFWLP